MSDNNKSVGNNENIYEKSASDFYNDLGEQLANMRARASNDLEELTKIYEALIEEEADISMIYHHKFFRDLQELKEMIEQDAQKCLIDVDVDTEDKDKKNSELQDVQNPTTTVLQD